MIGKCMYEWMGGDFINTYSIQNDPIFSSEFGSNWSIRSSN